MRAADTLYNHFTLPFPWNNHSRSGSTQTGTKTSTGPVTIWGASSSVGILAVQLAVASGASPGKHALLAELGGAHCFEYKSETVFGNITAVLADKGHGSAAYIFDAVGTSGLGLLWLECAGEESVLASVAFQNDPTFRMAAGIMNADIAMTPSHFLHAATMPTRVGDHALVWEVVKWMDENYGNGFRFVAVDVFAECVEDAINALKMLEGLGRGFGKIILKHPLL